MQKPKNDRALPGKEKYLWINNKHVIASKKSRIGKFSDGDNRIDILIIKLQKQTSLEHAIVHILRHRRQVEKFMLQGKIAARSDG